MNGKNRFLLLLPMLLWSSLGFSQGEQTVLDAPYVKEYIATKRVVPYPSLREADVMWSKRIWEFIDLKQKINHTLYFPTELIDDRLSLFEVIRKNLATGTITAYGLGPAQDDDEFKYAMTAAALDSLMAPEVTRYREVLDASSGEDKEAVTTKEPIKSADVIGYQIKEDWVFDKQRSERYVRIIGIAPVVLKYSESGEVKGSKILFWLYYPECRYVFNNFNVFNTHNGAQEMTFDQLFQLRLFQGYVIKEDNVYDRKIDAYTKGIDGLLESERIKNDLFLMEHDLWHY